MNEERLAAASDKTTSVENPLIGAGQNALLIEDDVANQRIMQLMLEAFGYTVVVAGDGQEGLEAAHLRRYDVIIMDVQMPVMDGLDTTRRIRAELPAEQQPKIVGHNANALKGERERCLKAGMDHYLAKPIRKKLLTRVLAELEQRKIPGES